MSGKQKRETFSLPSRVIKPTDIQTVIKPTEAQIINQTNEQIDKTINKEIGELSEAKPLIKRFTKDEEFSEQNDITLTSLRFNLEYFSKPKVKPEKEKNSDESPIPDRKSDPGFGDSLNQKLKPDMPVTSHGFHSNYFSGQPEQPERQRTFEQKISQIENLLFER